MNEFFLANNRSVVFGDVTIHQLKMHNIDEWTPHASVIKSFLKTHSDEIYKSLLKAHTVEVMALLGKSILKTERELILMAEASESTFLSLIEAVIKVNDAYFAEKEARRKGSRKAKEQDKPSWFETFQYLIEAGHRHEDILQMSYGSFIGYLKAAQKQRSQNLLTSTNLMRAAQHAKDKAFAKLTDDLRPVDD